MHAVTTSTRGAQLAVAHAHAAAEGSGDLAGTLGTLVDNPRFELLPIGVVLEGRDLIRDYYEHFFANFQQRVAGFTLRSEWITDEGLGQEYQIQVNTPEGLGRFDVIGILLFGDDDHLAGERIYASNDLFRLMVGPVLDRGIPVT
jgi:hypothetical protein